MVERTAVTLLLVLLLAAACDTDPGERSYGHLPEFCQEVMPRVDSFLAVEASGADGPASEDERYGGTAVVGAVGELAGGMNALVSADYAANQHQVFTHLTTLLRMNDQLELEPYLARDWELSEEGTRLTFHLRDDVRWHDGEPTTAHDVAFTFLRATDPETGFPNAAFWRHYVPGEDGVEVVDSLTVRFTLERPGAGILQPWRAVAVMPRHLLEDVPPAELRQHPYGTRCPVGNGPFRFVEHREGERWTFEANPAFPEELGGRPYLDRYVFRVVPEETTLLTELLRGNLDVYIYPNPDQVERLRQDEDLDLVTFPSRDYIFVAWNARRPQLADPRVRRAITVGTNRQEMVEAIIGGFGEVANSGVPPFHWAHMEALSDSLTYDPDRARALLDEAGWRDRSGDGVREDAEGEPLEIEILYNRGNQQRQEVAEIMQAQLARVGVRIRPRVMEWAALADLIMDPEERDFDGVVMGWVTEFHIDDSDLLHSSAADRPFGWAGLQDPEVDTLLEVLQLADDPDEALPLWEAYQHRVMELQPFTYIYFRDRLAGVHRRLRGVEMDVRGEWVNLPRWWIDPSDRRRPVTEP